MTTKKDHYKRPVFLAIILVALGVTFSTTMAESLGAIGTVFIALGGFFLIVGLTRKRDYEKKNTE